MANNKLREACSNIAEYARSAMCHATDAHILGYLNQIEEWAKAALAEPVKNCEVGTAVEQAKRWYWRYHVGHLCQSCPLGPRKWSEMDKGTLCFSEWLQMPYEEGGDK